MGVERGGPSLTLLSSCILAVAGCASAGSSTADTAPADGSPDVLRASVPATGSLEVLTGDELRGTGAGNVWEAVRRLRPLWLQRGRAVPVVYVAGIPHGAIRTLQLMNVDQVRRVEFLNGRDATTRYGTGHSGGVILVDLDRE